MQKQAMQPNVSQYVERMSDLEKTMTQMKRLNVMPMSS